MSKADYFTQIGVLFVPIGVSLIAVAPSLKTIGVALIVVGILSLLGGWIQVLREGAKGEKVAKQQLRVLLAIAGLLASIADKMGVDMNQTIKELVGKFDEHDLL